MTYRVPTSGGRESVSVATGVASSRDVVERGRRGGVQEGVKETERGATGSNESVVDQRDDTAEDGARATSSCNQSGLALEDNLDVVTHSSDIGEGTTTSVELAGVSVAECVQVGGDGGALIAWTSEDVGEATRREVSGGLGDTSGGTDGSHARCSVSKDTPGNVFLLTRGILRGRWGQSSCSGRYESQQHHRHLRQKGWKYHEHRVVGKQCKDGYSDY